MPDEQLEPTLRRQLRRLRLSPDVPPASPQEWQGFLQRISQAYVNNRQDLYLMERSVQAVSNEIQDLYTRMQDHADNRVAAERDRLRATISGFSDAFASMDMDGRIQTLNPAAEVMLGEDAVGTPLRDLLEFGPEVTAEVDGNLTMCDRIRSGHTIRDEAACVQRPDGTAVPVSVVVFPIRQRGDITTMGATIRDIADRLQAERTLRRLAMAVDASADAIYTTDTRGRIEYMNAAFTAITGYTAAQVQGENPRILSSGRTPARVYERMWERLSGGQTWTGRLLNRRQLPPADGEPRFEDYWAQTTITGYFDAENRLQGYVALQRDVTEVVARERRQATEAFAARLRAEIAALLHTQAPLAERLQGMTDLLTTSFAEHLGGHPALELRLFAEGTVAWAGSMPADWERHVTWADGKRNRTSLEVLDSSAVRAALGGAGLLLVPITHAHVAIGCAVLAASVDLHLDASVAESCLMIGEMVGLAVAEEHAWQAAEGARRAALGAADAKSKFLANMSHEIRTPMNGVLGMLDMLRHTRLDPKQEDYLDIAHTSAESLLTVINDILDFSKIEAGKVYLEDIPFDVRAAIEEVTTLFHASALRKSVELACYVPSDVPVGVRGDPTRLRQVLANIIGNAVKFTESGEVVVRVFVPDEPIVRGKRGQAVLRFEVADTGIGMQPEVVAHLFQPFSQADSSMTRRFGGTGLGLAISEQLIDLMGGEIRVASAPEHGTRFWFDLPFTCQPDAGSRLGGVASLAGARVLVVDDNETNRAILAHYLRDWDLDLDTASDGSEALGMMEVAAEAGRPYRVAMLDMVMPGLDGATLAGRIRSSELLAGTTLVLVSSAGVSDEKMREHGFDYAMSKPVRQSVVHDILLELAGRPAVPKARSAPEEPLLVAAGTVLLVEDNMVNQRVAMGMLSLLGVTVDLAADGAEALVALERGTYDLVLMDCQMPVMDGFEATRRLRALADPLCSVPVVAMTANAMAGDREECLAAGMDDYLSKPFSLKQLGGVVERWITQRGSQPGPQRCVDPAAIESLRDVMGDSIGSLVAVYLKEAPQLIGRIRAAIGAGDLLETSHAAHSLKSSSRVLGAQVLADLAARIERAADVAAAASLLRSAEEAYAAVADELRDVQRLPVGVRSR